MNNFKVNAVMSDKGWYWHFGINSKTASLYGDKVEDIVELTMKVAEDQTKPPTNIYLKKEDYWGYYDNSKKEFTLIYPAYFLLQMCFPYSLSLYEKRGDGKPYRLEIVK